MSTSDPTHIRLDSLENAVKHMTDRVVELAKYMERLVVLEERNNYTSEQIKDIRESFKGHIVRVEAQNAALQKELTSLKEKMIRLVAVFSCGTTALAVLAPHLIKFVLGAGTP